MLVTRAHLPITIDYFEHNFTFDKDIKSPRAILERLIMLDYFFYLMLLYFFFLFRSVNFNQSWAQIYQGSKAKGGFNFYLNLNPSNFTTQ